MLTLCAGFLTCSDQTNFDLVLSRFWESGNIHDGNHSAQFHHDRTSISSQVAEIYVLTLCAEIYVLTLCAETYVLTICAEIYVLTLCAELR